MTVETSCMIIFQIENFLYPQKLEKYHPQIERLIKYDFPVCSQICSNK